MSVDAALPDNGGLVPTDDVVGPKLTAKESVPAPPDDEVGDEDDPQASPKEGESEHETQKRLSGYERQKRARLRAEQYADVLLKRVNELEAKSPTEAKPKPEPESPPEFSFAEPEPSVANYVAEDGALYADGLDKFTKDHDAWSRRFDKAEAAHARTLEEKQKSAEQKRQSESEQKRIVRAQAWKQKHVDDMAKYPDWDEAMAKTNLHSETIYQAILDSEVGPHLAYWVAKHPEELAKMSAMPEAQLLRSIGKVEARLEAQFAQDESAEPDKDKEPPEPPQSKAPEPIHPVSKPSAAAKPFDPVRDADTMPWKQWKTKRDEQANKRK